MQFEQMSFRTITYWSFSGTRLLSYKEIRHGQHGEFPQPELIQMEVSLCLGQDSERAGGRVGAALMARDSVAPGEAHVCPRRTLAARLAPAPVESVRVAVRGRLSSCAPCLQV